MSNRPGCNSIAKQHSTWREHRFSISPSSPPISLFIRYLFTPLGQKLPFANEKRAGKKIKRRANAWFIDQRDRAFPGGVRKSLPASWCCCSVPTATASRSSSPPATAEHLPAEPPPGAATDPLLPPPSQPGRHLAGGRASSGCSPWPSYIARGEREAGKVTAGSPASSRVRQLRDGRSWAAAGGPAVPPPAAASSRRLPEEDRL